MAAVGTRDPVAPISYTSDLPSLLDFTKYIGGTKQLSGGSSSTTQTGDTAGLNAVLEQQLNPDTLLNLVQSLFAQAAQQVPALTSQYANATGTRVSNNTMLGTSLAQLNQSLAQAVAQSIVTQQAQASATAGKIADVNKTQTATKSDQTVQRPNASAKQVALPILLGTALNKIGGPKQAPTRPVGTTPTGPTAGDQPVIQPTGPDVPQVDFGNTAPIADTSGTSQVASSGAGVDDTGIQVAPFIGASSPDMTDIGSTDVSAGADNNADTSLDITGDVGSEDDLSSLFDSFGFADGGQVRGKPNFGPVQAPNYTPVMNVAPSPAVVQPNVTAAPAPAGATGKKKAVQQPTDDQTVVQSGAADATNAAPAGAPNTGINVSQVMAALGMVMAPSPISIANFATAVATGKNIAQNLVAQLLGLPKAQQEAGAMAENSIDPVSTATAQNSTLNDLGLTAPASMAQNMPDFMSFDPGAETSGETGSFSGSVDQSSSVGPGSDGGNTDSADTSDSSDSSDDSSSSDSSSDSDSGGGSGGSGGGDGGGDGGGEADGGSLRKYATRRRMPTGGYKDGGAVIGPGTSSSDSVPIRASVDEYVLPADVVQYIGVNTLDQLVDLIHTPIKGGSRG